MQQWFNVDGERHLLEAESVEDPGDRMEQVLNSFTAFLIEANVRFFFLPRLHTCAHESLLCKSRFLFPNRTGGITPPPW